MDKHNRKWLWSVIIIIALIIAAVVALGWLAAKGNKDTDDTVQNLSDTAQEATVDDDLLSRIADNPENYYGQTVSVDGEIQDLYNTRVFKISDQTAGDELLVITRVPLTSEQANEAQELFEDNADVSATGILRRLVITEVEVEYDVDLTEKLEAEFADQPVLIASSFTFSDNKAVLDFNQGP